MADLNERMGSMYDNLTLHSDKYQINMMYGHWIHGTAEQRVVFEVYFRKLPFGNGYAVFAGLERIIHYLEGLHFGDEELAYLREQEESYKPEFLEALRSFRFTGNLYAVKEGTPVFAGEPLLIVEARVFEAQLIETAILNFINYQTLIATKASRIKQVAPNDILLEFGTRRAQEADAAIWGARATYIAGFHATSNMRAGMLFDIPAKGTHAHSWVQGHATEEEAFRKYAEALPDFVTLLVDTYDTLGSGIPNAIKIGKLLEQQGKRMDGIRLDSGDLAYLSIEARRMLDEAGLNGVKIVASNDLDENIIFNLKAQGARIDIWGVGTQLITAADQPSLGGVYKLVAREVEGRFVPVIKISGNPEKVTTPGFKNAYRLISRKNGKAIADYITLRGETNVERGERLKLFDPTHTYIQKPVSDYDAVPLLTQIYKDGVRVYEIPTLEEVRAYHTQQMEQFLPQHKRKLNPETYRVSISDAAWQLKMDMLREHQG